MRVGTEAVDVVEKRARVVDKKEAGPATQLVARNGPCVISANRGVSSQRQPRFTTDGMT
jgi:hypothetical protein